MTSLFNDNENRVEEILSILCYTVIQHLLLDYTLIIRVHSNNISMYNTFFLIEILINFQVSFFLFYN